MPGRIVTLDQLRDLQRDRPADRAHVLTNGCYDLFHIGHLWLLQEAASHGRSYSGLAVHNVVVGIDTDLRVQALKGVDRPIRPFAERAAIVAALRVVAYVLPLGDKPDGYTLEEIMETGPWAAYVCRQEPPAPEAAIAERLGIPVMPFARIGDHSTSREIEAIECRLRMG